MICVVVVFSAPLYVAGRALYDITNKMAGIQWWDVAITVGLLTVGTICMVQDLR
jgi:hypothetical protein